MKIENLVTSMSELKAKLKLADDVDMDRYNQAYIEAIDMLITRRGDIHHIIAEYKTYASLKK